MRQIKTNLWDWEEFRNSGLGQINKEKFGKKPNPKSAQTFPHLLLPQSPEPTMLKP